MEWKDFKEDLSYKEHVTRNVLLVLVYFDFIKVVLKVQ